MVHTTRLLTRALIKHAQEPPDLREVQRGMVELPAVVAGDSIAYNAGVPKPAGWQYDYIQRFGPKNLAGVRQFSDNLYGDTELGRRYTDYLNAQGAHTPIFKKQENPNLFPYPPTSRAVWTYAPQGFHGTERSPTAQPLFNRITAFDTLPRVPFSDLAPHTRVQQVRAVDSEDQTTYDHYTKAKRLNAVLRNPQGLALARGITMEPGDPRLKDLTVNAPIAGHELLHETQDERGLLDDPRPR